jgi:hypothetical protein
MSQIGQEGDTRKYQRPKRDAYYASKSAVEADARRDKSVKRCFVCKDVLDDSRIMFGNPPDRVFCHRCWSE